LHTTQGFKVAATLDCRIFKYFFVCSLLIKSKSSFFFFAVLVPLNRQWTGNRLVPIGLNGGFRHHWS